MLSLHSLVLFHSSVLVFWFFTFSPFLPFVLCFLAIYILARILDRNGSFEIGLKLLRSVWSSPAFFFSRGSTVTCLKALGNTPVDRERLTILVTQSSFLKSLQGRMSEEQEEDFILDNKAKISAKDMVLNEGHVLETGSMTARDGIFSIIILILSVKNLKKHCCQLH